MNIPPLAILQCRMGSKRLPGKVLKQVGSETLVQRVYRLACDAFGAGHTVIAHPDNEENRPLAEYIDGALGAQRFAWVGPEDDVLGRFYHCAHRFRWSPDSVLLRITCDDWNKSPAAMRRVAAGERLPVEIGGEAFTLAMLDEAHVRLNSARYAQRAGNWVAENKKRREHITYALFPTSPPHCPPGCWTIDTEADLLAARAKLAEMEG